MGKQFITNSMQLIQMFSGPRQLSYEQQKFFDDPDYPGCKAIEAFAGDITRNLIAWMVLGSDAIAYQTKKYWYIYERQAPGSKIINCTRYCNHSYRRWDTWLNEHSVSVGKQFLSQHKDKRVPFVKGEE